MSYPARTWFFAPLLVMLSVTTQAAELGDPDRRLSTGGYIRAMAVSPDGKYLASWDLDNSIVQVWSTADWKPVVRIKLPKGEPIRLKFLGDGRLFTGLLKAKRLQFWSVPDGKKVFDEPIVDPFRIIMLAETGESLASYHKGNVRVRNLKTNHTWDTTVGRFNGFRFTPDGKYLNVVGYLTLRVYDAKTGKELSRFKSEHRNGMRGLRTTPDGKTFFYHMVRSLYVVNYPTGRTKREIHAGGTILKLAIARNASQFAAFVFFDNKGSIQMGDWRNGKLTHHVPLSRDPADIRLGNDARWLAVTQSRAVLIWNLPK